MTTRLRGIAAVAATAVLAGCGGSSDPDPVDRYVDAVNAVQRGAAPQFEAANTAYQQFAKGKLRGRAAATRLRQAELDIEAARQRLAAVHPPAQARHLHELVLRTFELNVLMAADTRQMAIYQSQSQAALAPLTGLRKQLRRKLGSAAGPDGQIRALRSYAAAVERIQHRMNRLHPPAILDSTRQTQLTLLGRAGPLARRLAAAIERRDAPAVTRLIRSFRAAGVSPQESRGLLRGSILAYRQRLEAIDRTGAQARAELARLVRQRR